MEQEEFQRYLEMFPIVRSRNYCADDDAGTSRQVSSKSPSSSTVPSQQKVLPQMEDALLVLRRNIPLCKVESGSPSQETATTKDTVPPPTSVTCLGGQANFWDLLKAAAEQQYSPEEAKRFCDALKARHNELVNQELSLDAIERIAMHWPPPTK